MKQASTKKVTAEMVKKDLKKLGSPKKAATSSWFFKTGEGQYGFGDMFFGVTMPEQRIIAKKYAELPLIEIKKLLYDIVHECRLTGLLILVSQYEKAIKGTEMGTKSRAGKYPQRAAKKSAEKIVQFYLKNIRRANNWDLIDSSAHQILGDYILRNNFRKSLSKIQIRQLYTFAQSKNIWEKRAAIVATYAFIKENQLDETFKISRLLMADTHDLIHKACGWMLREAGKRDRTALIRFLDAEYTRMPRTMLRYSLEKFTDTERRKYMAKSVLKSRS